MIIGYKGFHDPADVADYSFDFAGLLNGQLLASVTATIDSAASAAGVQLSNGVPASVSGTRATFWVSTSNPANPAFAAGIEAVITLRVNSDGNPPRTFERSVKLLIRQSDSTVSAAATPVPAASYGPADLNAINAAIASGATEVRYADGSSVKYRDLNDMLKTRDMIAAIVAPPPTMPGRNPSVALVSFAGAGR
jgi:hypothetical protein